MKWTCSLVNTHKAVLINRPQLLFLITACWNATCMLGEGWEGHVKVLYTLRTLKWQVRTICYQPRQNDRCKLCEQTKAYWNDICKWCPLSACWNDNFVRTVAVHWNDRCKCCLPAGHDAHVPEGTAVGRQICPQPQTSSSLPYLAPHPDDLHWEHGEVEIVRAQLPFPCCLYDWLAGWLPVCVSLCVWQSG